MKISHITDYLESVAPLRLQEDYDNSGLLTGNPGMDCSAVLCTLDVTEEVVEEAIKKNCNLIVAHHPIIFRGVKRITGFNYVERVLIRALKNDVAIYAAHTNFDNIISGVNGKIADLLELTNRRILCPRETGESDIGSGLVGEIGEMTETGFLELLKKQFGVEVIRHSALTGRSIKAVAVCGGAGSFLIANALKIKADVFVTADLKYHEFFDAENLMLLCDIGHFESEQYSSDLFVDLLLRKFLNFAVLKSEINTNPVKYFTGK